MKKPSYEFRIAIIMIILTVIPIGATQLGWYLYGKQVGFNFGMVAGTISVILVGYLMYQKGWRDEDEDWLMEKIIFFGLAIPILAFVIYLGGGAIMKGFNAKVSNRPNKSEDEKQDISQDTLVDSDQLSGELNRLNELLKSGVLTQEEFEKAKKKILDN